MSSGQINRRNAPRVPWVNVLGEKQGENVSAREAYENLGPYDVSLRDVFIQGEKRIETLPYGASRATTKYSKAPRHQAIVRGPTATDLSEKVFNVVGNKYRLITPDVIVDLWDKYIGRPVTSIGALDGGERFFLATKLPTVRVPGDKEGIDNTLVLVSPMNGRQAIVGLLVPIRLICTNGMVAMGDIKEAFTLRHYQNNVKQLPEWLKGVYDRNIANLDRMEQAWNTLAKHMITDQEVRDTLDVAFPLPVPQPDMDMEQRDQHLRQWDSAQKHRSLTREFFNGRGAGMDNKANHGTAYGFYNSFVELIDWGANAGEGAKMATVRSAAMGMAYKKKEAVLTHLVGVAN